MAGSKGAHRSRRGSRPTSLARRLLLGCAGVVVVVLGWLTWTGLEARAEIRDASAAVARVRVASTSGDLAAMDAAVATATQHAQRAHALTADPVWRVASWLPVVGQTPSAIAQTAAGIDTLVSGVLPDLTQAARGLDPKRLRTGSRIDVEALAAAAPAVSRAAARLSDVQAALGRIDLTFVLPSVGSGVRSVRAAVAETQETLAEGAAATKLLPVMLGSTGVRRYLVVLQNNAEARGTGGLVGAFAVLEVKDGLPTLVRLGSDSELVSAKVLPVDLGANFRRLFGNDPALWANTNLSAHFPYAARLQVELWRRQFGQQLDGVIATDPVAFGYLLSVTGPVQVPGVGAVDGTTFADVAMRKVYATFPAAGQERERTAYVQALARTALDRVLTSTADVGGLVRALGRATTERRLLVYSTKSDEEAVLASTALGGVVDDRTGPYAALVVDNEAGNKLDYYLDRSLAYVAADCQGGSATVTVTVRDNAPATGLPAYAAYRQDRGPTSGAAGRGGDGSTRIRLLVYAAVGAELNRATVDGDPAAVVFGVDGSGAGRPVFALSVELTSGQERTLVLRLTEPAVDEATSGARVWVGPLVRTPKATVQAPTCR